MQNLRDVTIWLRVAGPPWLRGESVVGLDMDPHNQAGLSGGHGAQLTGAYWLDSPVHEQDDCMWCRQLLGPGVGAQSGVSRRQKNVPLHGLSVVRAAMIGLAVVTIVVGTLSVAVA